MRVILVICLPSTYNNVCKSALQILTHSFNIDQTSAICQIVFQMLTSAKFSLLQRSTWLHPHGLFHSFFKYKFIYFILFILVLAALGLLCCTWAYLSLVVVSGGHSSLWCAGFSLWWLLLLGAQALGVRASVVVTHGLSSCSSRALECRLSSCGAWA